MRDYLVAMALFALCVLLMMWLEEYYDRRANKKGPRKP